MTNLSEQAASTASTREELIGLAIFTAAKHDVDPALFCALCDHESGGWKQYAVRYEPAFMARYVAPIYQRKEISATEAWGRAFSYGLAQIMGQTARELGFDGEFLTELLEPEVGLEFGCRKLAKCLHNANGDVMKGLMAYNGGGNPQYPGLVLARVAIYNAEKVSNADQVQAAAAVEN